MRRTTTIRNIVFFILILTLIFITLLSKISILNTDIVFGTMFTSIMALFIMFSKLEKQHKELLNLYLPISEIFENSPEAIYYKDKYLKYTGANKAFLQLHGLTLEELKGKTDADLYPDSVEKIIRQNELVCLQSKKCLSDNKHIKFCTNEEKIFETIRIPLHSNKGDINGIAGISRDITKRKIAEKELVTKQSQLAGILDNMPYIAYLKDLKGNIVCCNRKYKELLNAETITLFGEREQKELLSAFCNKFNDDEEKVINNTERISFEKKINLNGQEFWLEIHKAPLLDKQKNITGVVVTSKDITKQKELDAQKELFVATLTHDLKSPISAQIQALDLLINGQMGYLNGPQTEFTKEIRNSCSYIKNIVEMLLCSQKFENGCVKLEPEVFNLYELAEECNKELLCAAIEKNLYINIKGSSSELKICADKFELKRVIMNLLSNAISYSKHNSTIDIQITRICQKVIVEVINIGEYIHPLELKRLFEKYFSKAEKFTKIGTGLGLYLSQQIIQAHGGQMIAKSSESKINTFGFELDLDKLSKLFSKEISTNQ